VQIAVDSTATNAPAGLSAADLFGIYTGTYTTWNQLPGNSGGSTDTIIPLIPPSGVVDLQDVHRRPDDCQRRHGAGALGQRQDRRAERPDGDHRRVDDSGRRHRAVLGRPPGPVE
jgi:hypothetical protein